MHSVADVGVGDLLVEDDGRAVVLAAVLPRDDEGAPLGRLQLRDLVLRAEPQPGRQDQPHQGVRVVVRPGNVQGWEAGSELASVLLN